MEATPGIHEIFFMDPSQGLTGQEQSWGPGEIPTHLNDPLCPNSATFSKTQHFSE